MKSYKLAFLAGVTATAMLWGGLVQAADAKPKTLPRVDSRTGHGPEAGLEQRPRPAAKTLGDGPWVFDTMDYKVKVTKLGDKLERPYSIAFLPDGGILVTERPGRLLLFPKTGQRQEITGTPEVLARDFVGLMDVVLHPKFKENRWVYFGYAKPSVDGGGNCAIGRARYEGGNTLGKFEELFVGSPPIPSTDLQNAKVRLAFHGEYMYAGCSVPDMDRLEAQNPRSDFGKILRLYHDGSIPADNPLVGKSEFGLTYKPEIYSVGHRSTLGLAIHPTTGVLWEVENGPFGGDEVNVIQAGGNYGWPIISLGIEYDGTTFPLQKEGYVDPIANWTPAIAPSGMTFYTGDKFPRWKGNLFVGGLIGARVERLAFNAKGLPTSLPGRYSREHLLEELEQRIRDVREGPDGFLYVVTDYATEGALLRIEPADPVQVSEVPK